VRRCLHAFLIGLLTLSQSTDAARACWFLRHGCRGPRVAVAACPRAVEAYGLGCDEQWLDGCAAWQEVAEVIVAETVIEPVAACDCCQLEEAGADVIIVGEGEVVGSPSWETTVGEAETVVSSLGAPPLEDHGLHDDHDHGDRGDRGVEDHSSTHHVPHDHAVIPSAPAPGEPTLAEPVDPAGSVSPVPTRAPAEEVRQAVALGEPVAPAADTVPPAEPPLEEEVPETELSDEPAATEPNLFEEVDQAAAGPAVSPPEASTADPLSVEPRASGEVPAPEADQAPTADPFDAAGRGPHEPIRRWIDRSGDYAVVGRLDAVRDDGTCVLRTAGGTVAVPLESLSSFDRGYATAAAARFAAARGPETRDTAGL